MMMGRGATRACRALVAIVSLFLAAACAKAAADGIGPAPRQERLRAMTYNIRLDLASDGTNAWPHRRERVAALIASQAPDVLGLQEVLAHQKRDLEAALPAYSFAGVGRDDGAVAGEFSPVAWRRDRFVPAGSGTFWLSSTPSRPGKGWDAAYPRIATWVLLRDRDSGRMLRVVSTHFDNVGAQARERSAELVARWSKPLVRAGEAAIVLGDFNSGPGSSPIVLLADEARSGLRMARDVSQSAPEGPTATYNGFRNETADEPPIDHVFVSPDLSVLRHVVVSPVGGGPPPSDHYPVVVDLAFGAAIARDLPASRR